MALIQPMVTFSWSEPAISSFKNIVAPVETNAVVDSFNLGPFQQQKRSSEWQTAQVNKPPALRALGLAPKQNPNRFIPLELKHLCQIWGRLHIHGILHNYVKVFFVSAKLARRHAVWPGVSRELLHLHACLTFSHMTEDVNDGSWLDMMFEGWS